MKLIGVKASVNSVNTQQLKREILAFDRIGIVFLDGSLELLKSIGTDEAECVLREVEWLCENDLLFEVQLREDAVGPLIACKEFWETFHAIDVPFNELKKRYERRGPEMERMFRAAFARAMHRAASDRATLPMSADLRLLEQLGERLARLECIRLRRLEGLSALPILPSVDCLDGETNKEDVIQIVLKSFPIPDESTSWEEILDFRCVFRRC